MLPLKIEILQYLVNIRIILLKQFLEIKIKLITNTL